MYWSVALIGPVWSKSNYGTLCRRCLRGSPAQKISEKKYGLFVTIFFEFLDSTTSVEPAKKFEFFEGIDLRPNISCLAKKLVKKFAI